MKLISFERAGRASFGCLAPGDGVIDLGRRVGGALIDHLDDLARLESHVDDEPDLAMADVRLLPPVADARRIVCVGLNYCTHIAETGREPPAYPILFARFADSIVGHGELLVRPSVSEQFDFEGELAFVIGKPGRHVAPEHAWEHVAGLMAFNDGSIRDYQRHTSQFLPGKAFHRSGSAGPWLATGDDMPEPTAMTLTTRLNGVEMQSAPISDLLFDMPALIAYCSAIWPLSPGDVIATGTPGGVGAFRQPPVWMKPGDRIEVEITGLGTLVNSVTTE